MGHLESPIFGDWVMERDDGWNNFLDLKDSRAEALIVVHEIKIVDAFAQHTVGTKAKRKWFAESSLQEKCCFNKIWPGIQLPISRKSSWVVVIENIQTW